MPTLSLASLLVQETKAAIYAKGLQLAQAVGLSVSTWQPGDPTRSLYSLEAELLSTLESVVAGFISSGFLDYATGFWLKFGAKQGFNVDVPPATFAAAPETLTNTGGGVYDIDPGDLTFKSSTTGKTYRNTTGGHLGAGGSLSVTVVADEAGSASSAGVGEIDTMVTTLLGVTCANTAVAIGVDEQPEDTTRQQCRDKTGPISPDGPKQAYSFVARDPVMSGTSGVSRVRPYSDSTYGYVTTFLADAAGGVSESVRSLVEAGIVKWATPLCVTPTVLAATNVASPVTYTLWVYKSVNKTAAQVQADVQAALAALFAGRPIGGDVIPPATTGALNASTIIAAIEGIYPQAFRAVLTAPAGDVALATGQVAALGAVTGTINFVADP